MDHVFVCGKEVLASTRVLDQVGVPDIKLLDLSQLIMKDVVDLDLIDERDGKLVAGWVHSYSDERLGLMTN